MEDSEPTSSSQAAQPAVGSDTGGRFDALRNQLSNEQVLIELACLAGIIAFAASLFWLTSTQIGADPLAALAGMASVLPQTLPVTLAVTLALAINIAGGAIVMRLVSGEPFRSLSQAILCGLAGAVLLDVLAMGVLAGLGVFRWPFLVVFLALPFVLIRRARPLLAAMPERPTGDGDRPLNGWLLVGLLWLPPLIFALASPVVPFVDVPPNHVAPVEHLRTFGSLASISTTPDAFYGPSRILLGYQALLGMLDGATGALAATAVAQFVVPLAGLVALSAWCLARAIGGPRAGLWALLLVPISLTYLRLDDSRAGVLVFPLVALALWMTVEPLGASQLRRVFVLGGAIGSAMLVHPLIGLYAAGFLGIGAVLRPSWHAGHVWPALAVGATLALPQVAATAGLAMAPWLVVLPIPLAVGVGFVAVRISNLAPALEKWVAPALVGAVVVGGLILVALARPEYLKAAFDRLWRDNGFAVTVAVALLAVLAWRRRGMEFIAGAVITAVVVAIAAIPLQQASGLASVFYDESPKFVYIVPTLLAIAAAVGVAALWASDRVPLVARAGVTALLLVVVAIPLNDPVKSEFSLGEHGWSEAASIDLRGAARGGFWQFPDWRQLIDGEQQELVARLRQEIDSGRLGPTTPVLEVAWSYRLWGATPMAVFTGAMVSTATPEPEISGHTVGGRLHDIAELPALVGPAYPYIVYEPAALDPAVRDTIVNAGYRSIFANDRGEIFIWPQPRG